MDREEPGGRLLLTRTPDSPRAGALARDGIDIVKGDLDDEATLRRALAGAWGVFGVRNAGEAGVAGEEAQGKRPATLARIRGIGGQADGHPALRQQVAHRGNRARPSLPSHVILRPVFFMENLLAPYSLQGSTLAGARARHEATDDCGGRHRLVRRARLHRRRRLEILTQALGRPITFAQAPIEPVRQYNNDVALMLEWFERVGYSADIARLEREFGRKLTKFPDRAHRQTRPNGR